VDPNQQKISKLPSTPENLSKEKYKREKISQQIYIDGWLLAIKETEHFVWHIYYGWVHHASTGITNK
jgi:hypothetical protein